MNNTCKLLGLLLLITNMAFGQNVRGFIFDASTKEALTGVNVYYNDKDGTKGSVSDIDGHYELSVPEGHVTLVFRYLGYETQSIPFKIESGQSYTKDVKLAIQSNIMDEVVVSVGRYEQKLSDITVSMELLKAKDIEKQSPKDLTDALKNVSGIEITDRQPSVRGGTGWTYGVGSRCLILLDGMSMLTPGSGEINWNVIPMENVEQVEVLKGASSVLYGSSALNGLVNVRTKRPGLEPSTQINLNGGIYGKPRQDGDPMYGGIDLSHARRMGNFDLSAGLNAFSDAGYRQDNYNHRMRFGGNLTYHNPHVHGLNYGVNANYLYNDYKGFFLWRSPDDPYVQSPLANMGRREHTFYIDPFLNYSNAEKGTTHRFKGRFSYRGSGIQTNTTSKSLEDIANNMGFDSGSVPEIVGMVENWQTELLPVLLPYVPDVMNGKVSGLMGEIGKLGNRFFPTATPADYMDLISWVMGRTPIPTDKEGLNDWLANAMNPVEQEAPKNTDRTYSYYMDYQYSKKFDNSQLTVGGTYERVQANSKVTGRHSSDNVATFLQYDHKFFDKLNVSAGVRFEYYRVDDFYREAETNIFGAKIPVKPVFRGGLNYELAEYSFIRASFGQGYRYPSVTEKFVLKDIGGVGAFPNAQLKAEQGYNAELGFKQGYKFGNLKGFIDLAGFYTRYTDMIEFRFGLFNKKSFDYVDGLSELFNALSGGDGIGIGAQFTNMGRAEIYGVDLSTSGVYDFNPHTRLLYNLGYVYTNPIDMDVDARNAEEEANADLLAMRSKSNDSKYLKYRQKHSLKGVFDLEWKQFSLGANMAWKSKTLAVDYFMVDERAKADSDLMDYMRLMLFGNLHDYWAEHNTSYFTMDLRLGMKINKNLQIRGVVNNVLNSAHSSRPMDVAAPRTFVLHLGANF